MRVIPFTDPEVVSCFPFNLPDHWVRFTAARNRHNIRLCFDSRSLLLQIGLRNSPGHLIPRIVSDCVPREPCVHGDIVAGFCNKMMMVGTEVYLLDKITYRRRQKLPFIDRNRNRSGFRLELWLRGKIRKQWRYHAFKLFEFLWTCRHEIILAEVYQFLANILVDDQVLEIEESVHCFKNTRM